MKPKRDSRLDCVVVILGRLAGLLAGEQRRRLGRKVGYQMVDELFWPIVLVLVAILILLPQERRGYLVFFPIIPL